MLQIILLLQATSAMYISELKKFPLKKNGSFSPEPHTYTSEQDLPRNWDWANIDGVSYITKSLNQHIPQYCGSCWAHAALSCLADRVKIARQAKGTEINLSIQYILNCGQAGSCHGGDAVPTYEWIHESGGVPFDTCLPYEACSAESTDGSCKGRSQDFSCEPMNICRTCNTFASFGGKCTAIDRYPNVTVSEYGSIDGAQKMKAELYRRGPITVAINAEPILDYQGGIFNDVNADKQQNHAVAVTGYGFDEETQQEYWIVRNSWGQYWGEMGFFRVLLGQNVIGIERGAGWAVPGTWTEHNFPCGEDGTGCIQNGVYEDPSVRLAKQ